MGQGMGMRAAAPHAAPSPLSTTHKWPHPVATPGAGRICSSRRPGSHHVEPTRAAVAVYVRLSMGRAPAERYLAGPPATVLQRPSCVRQRPAATSHHPAIWGHACHATWHVGALPTTGGAFGALLHANTYVLKLDVAGAAPTGTSEAPARSEGKMGRAGARARRSRRAASVSRARRLLLLDPLRRRVDR